MNYNKQIEIFKKSVIKRFRSQPHQKRVKSEPVDFTIIPDRVFLPIDQSATNTTETRTSQIYSFNHDEEELSENKEPLYNNTEESLHNLCQKEYPEINNPYQVIGITYTSNCQHYTSVYKKWTYCNVSNYSLSDE